MQNFTAKEIHRISLGLPPWESMSFACGGWLQCYMFGVIKALQSKGLDKGVTYCGCSAGSLAAAGIALNCDPDVAIQYIKEDCIPKAYRSVNGLFQLKKYISDCFDKCIGPNYNESHFSELQVAITKLPFFTGERVSQYNSIDELKNALLASCAAFPFSSLIKIKDSWYIDGGWSDFQPTIDRDTITVSPFYFSDCDIKPTRYVPLWWTFLPPHCSDTVDWLYSLGYADCLNYIKQRGIPNTPRTESEIINNKNEHPYDVPCRVSMHRFLGYDLRNMTNHYIYFFMDFVLLMLLIFVWKPIALCLIYIELILRIVCLSILLVVNVVFEFYLPLIIRKFIILPYFKTLSNVIGTKIFKKLSEEDDNTFSTLQIRKIYKDLWHCVTCFYSLSLFLRFLTVRPSSVELRKHDRLARASLLYRIFRHII